MEKNVGGYDRGLRIVVGLVLLFVGLAALGGAVALGTALAALAALVGVVLLGTGVAQKCVINSVLGVDTYRKEGVAEDETEDLGAERPS